MYLDYPLRFEPILRRYLWGGRRLETVLGKTLPSGDDYAESWELVDHGQDQSIVTTGPLSGVTLHQLVRRHGTPLLGQHAPQPQFPLLFKFLDAQKNLSVQVHPNDQQAARLAPPDRGKTEAWIVLHADPGSRIYAGLHPHVDRETLREAIAAGTAEDCLHALEPAVGDCLFVPAGTVHAIGAGLVIAEIQQASDITYRLYDWNRVGPDGNLRQLHVQEALAVIDFSMGPVWPRIPEPTDEEHVSRLVTCDKFVIDRWSVQSARVLGGDNRCHLVVPLDGEVAIERDACPHALRAGQSMLAPAAAGPLHLEPHGCATLLDIYMPPS